MRLKPTPHGNPGQHTVPVTDMPVGIVDAHIHQWDPFTTPREVSVAAKITRRAPYLLGPTTRLFPGAAREFVRDPSHLFTRYLPADYRADAAPLHIDTVVHVEAGWKSKDPFGSVAETRWIAGLPFGVDGAPALGGIVVHAELSDPQAAAIVDAHLAASPLVRGVRCLAAHSDDPGVLDWTPSPHLLIEPAFLDGFAALAERDLTFDAWVYSHQLPDVITLASTYPETTIVLDHYGTPVGAYGPRGQFTGATASQRAAIVDRWRDDIHALAELPNVVAKHSGTAMPVLGPGPMPRDQLCDAAAPLISHLQTCFGVDRTFWSSNFPIDKPNVALPESISVLREVLGDSFDEAAVLRNNARRSYRI